MNEWANARQTECRYLIYRALPELWEQDLFAVKNCEVCYMSSIEQIRKIKHWNNPSFCLEALKRTGKAIKFIDNELIQIWKNIPDLKIFYVELYRTLVEKGPIQSLWFRKKFTDGDTFVDAIKINKHDIIYLERRDATDDIISALIENKNIKKIQIFDESESFEVDIFLDSILTARSDIEIEHGSEGNKGYFHREVGYLYSFDKSRIIEELGDRNNWKKFVVDWIESHPEFH